MKFLSILCPGLFGKAMQWLMYLAAAALLLCGVWAAGHQSGRQAERIDALKTAGASIALAHRVYQADVRRGQEAVSTMLARVAQLAADNESLTRRLAHVPRFASTAACPQPGAARLTRGGVLRLNTALGAAELPASAASIPGAFAGADPAGGPDLSESVIGSASDISIDAAQSNAEINFGRCAAIRTRCLALIDYLKARPTDGSVDGLTPAEAP